ncbi:metal ABC transporter ATP-binding protein [Pseudalkalibacillus caeni]|uniref:Metal ABC transporter ATP-binding protein n=1 Tax=Exobacillus caeni TaxID=2574798 RepID=A0A5R9F1I4_9BACL|nr:metal ABC transporter ATP-binding protein [Pseudalkalibacillus caeni]TLS36286.1 metal ABC transporter ATP-binding protein [Pseudalkalibacillus caeni]
MENIEQDNAVLVKNLFFHYSGKYVLEDITLSVPRGAFVGLVGPNGSGKSTLIKCILGLQKPQKGNIYLFGKPQSKFNQWNLVGFVSQKANSFNSGFPATVFEVVSMGLAGKKGIFRFLNARDRKKINEALALVGMERFSGRNIGELSGGQQQRVFIARALVSEPELLILDEPTVGVDAASTKEFYDLLGRLNVEEGITLLLVTHDIGTITDKVTHVACLNRTLHFHGKTEEFEQLQEGDISEYYGHQLHVLSHDHHGGQN